MDLSNSREDYLKAIYQICEKERVARVKSIAKQLNVSQSSVNYAVNVLLDSGLIKHKRYGYIELTEKGRKTGKQISLKHQLIKKFLKTVLEVDEKIADKDACRIEHAISKHTLKKIISFMNLKGNEGDSGEPDRSKKEY